LLRLELLDGLAERHPDRLDRAGRHADGERSERDVKYSACARIDAAARALGNGETLRAARVVHEDLLMKMNLKVIFKFMRHDRSDQAGQQ
jgi:hypothetical protein